jgi:nucleoside-diphosphate-sugar epimerase
MEILVVGGTRFIGPYVVRALTSQGHTVTVFHRGEHEPHLPASVKHVHDPSAGIPVLSFPAEARQPPFDVVIHMIAMGERDATAAVHAFRGRVGRLVALSSGDVYRAYGRFTGVEAGPREEGLLQESSPLRSVLYPYRKQARSPDDWVYWYDKILVERAVLDEPGLPSVVLRLPKVYGPGENDDLTTVYAFRHRPQWRWTHGYVENIAHAIVLAAFHPSAAGVYNVGEQHTPTVAERLTDLPASSVPEASLAADFDQDIVYDTTRIRQELGYSELVGYRDGLCRTLGRDRLLDT